MKRLFFILGLLLSINAFSQTEANTEAIRGIVGNESKFDTTSNPVVNYIRDYINKTNCICYPKLDEVSSTPLYFNNDFFKIKGLGEKQASYFYTTYTSDTSKTDNDFLKSVLEKVDEDFQERYTTENVDYYNLNGIENFNFLVFDVEIYTEYTYFDIDVFDDVTKHILRPYKILVLIGYDN
jgi:hypothetical protein